MFENTASRNTAYGFEALRFNTTGSEGVAGSFDVIVSNLCLHNIYDRPTRLLALQQIVRVLKPGGVALISDYKLTAEYADEFRKAGLVVEKKRGSLITTFPPLTVVIARKPM